MPRRGGLSLMPAPGMQEIKNLAKAIIPLRLRTMIRRCQFRVLGSEHPFKGMTNKDIFAKIYAEKHWGGAADNATPYSGPGSHQPHITIPYIQAIHDFLGGFAHKKTLVDLGCGDFNIGGQIAPLAERYIACDIVETIIDYNKAHHSAPHIEFRVLDLVNDPLPAGDIVFVRQVLQHLNNADVAAFSKKLAGANYQYLVLTEHVPTNPVFRPNLNKPTGANIRVQIGSGIVLTQPPFNLSVKSEKIICDVPAGGGMIRTTVYEF